MTLAIAILCVVLAPVGVFFALFIMCISSRTFKELLAGYAMLILSIVVEVVGLKWFLQI